jgi:uncharacterized protein YbjQ (UPF0145 family)
MIITTTQSIENHEIEAYLDIVTGTDIYLVGGLLGGGLVNQENLYTNAFQNAKAKMAKKAANLKADAIIGFTTNVTSAANANNIIVITSGTAVTLRKRTLVGKDNTTSSCDQRNCNSQQSSHESYRQNRNDTPFREFAQHDNKASIKETLAKRGFTILNGKKFCAKCGRSQNGNGDECEYCGHKFSE